MIQYSLLGRTAASTRLNTTFRGLAPSPSSGKTLVPIYVLPVEVLDISFKTFAAT